MTVEIGTSVDGAMTVAIDISLCGWMTVEITVDMSSTGRSTMATATRSIFSTTAHTLRAAGYGAVSQDTLPDCPAQLHGAGGV